MRRHLMVGGCFAVATAAWLGIGFAQPQPAAGALDDMEQPAPGYSGPRFVPSYDFPTVAVAEPRPWTVIDFRNDANGYMAAVLAYVLAGQDKSRWNVASNLVRKWYHMPWMGPGGKGREFISGLTSERRSRPGELGPNQTRCRQNWAVGFYNPTGAVALGRIWRPITGGTGTAPDLSGLPFAEGTVVAKALYTQADANEVALLAGAPTIQANIIRDDTPNDSTCPGDEIAGQPAPRAPATLRLLQLDVAVRDARAGATGWVFGDLRLRRPDGGRRPMDEAEAGWSDVG